MSLPTENFTPPTPEQVSAYLHHHPLRGPSKLHAWVPIIGLGMVLMLAIMFDQGIGLLLPWLVLIGVLVYSGTFAARIRKLQQKVTQVQELALLRFHVQSLRLGWRTLPKVTHLPELYLRLCALMAANLGQLRSHEAAIVLLDDLIERLPDDHPGAVQMRMQRAVAELASDRLLDADRSLRWLRDRVNQPGTEPAASVYRFAQLYQAVRTLRDEDAVNDTEKLIDALRPLGTEAGYGYALAAVAHYRLAQRRTEQADTLMQQAGLWWGRATILVRPQLLLERLPELEPMLRDASVVAAQMPTTPPVSLQFTNHPQIKPFDDLRRDLAT